VENNSDLSLENKGAPIPKTFWEYVKGFGPGIVVVLTWLGAGDLVDCAVSGANYGYALMWGLALALLVRYALVSIIAKYQLLNIEGHTTLEGYGKIFRLYPVILGIGGVLLGHFYESYTISGSGEALYHITGIGTPLIWSVVAVVAAIAITGRSIYRYLELSIKIILALLVVTLLGSAIMVGPDVGAMARGTFAFAVPEQVGPFGAILVVVSLIGAVGGSLANLLYPTFMKEKGYIRPEHLKVQRYDMLFGIIVIIVLDLAIWVLGAEVLHPRGITISSFTDLGRILGELFGRFGEVIIYLGVFGACFSSVIGYAVGFPKMGIDAIYSAWPERKKKYENNYIKDPVYQLFYIVVIAVALIWSIPGMPGFIFLTVVVNAAQIILLPLVAIGLLIIINRKDLVKQGASIFENALLVFLTALALWGAYQTAISLL